MPGFDLAKTDALRKLFARPRELRDEAWRSAFLEVVVDASLASTAEQVMTGPDGLPYFVLCDPPVAQPFTPYCVSAILDHCTSNGIGIAINPRDGMADGAFTYGDLWSLRAYGTFAGDPDDQANDLDPAAGSSIEVFAEDTRVKIGSPNEAMIPTWARSVLASFLSQAAGVEEPGVLAMIYGKAGRRPSRHLVFNVYPDDFPSMAEFRSFMGALRWFLPPKRAYLATSRDAPLASSFVPLVLRSRRELLKPVTRNF